MMRRAPGTSACAGPCIDDRACERIVIEDVWPEIDGGRHPAKRIVGDTLEVGADIFCDGHDVIAAALRHRAWDEAAWHEVPMRPLENDRWIGQVPLTRNLRWLYTIEAWRDLFATWRRDYAAKRRAGEATALELLEGRALVEAALVAAAGSGAQALARHLDALPPADAGVALAEALLAPALAEDMARFAPRGSRTRYRRELCVIVDRPAARFAAWYELFPRSMSDDASRHGTFADVIRHLPRIRDMGFDVLYLTPIHPIGRTHRKGRNNSLPAGADEPGSPYAVGAAEGGHTAVHPELGDLEGFRSLVAAARREGLEVALDFAVQCSPDHPWIKAHPEWFDWRPDGTIKFAENPPQKYQDIVNLEFYGQGRPALWQALCDVVLFWIGQGVTTFRVDNPHTKPVPFWEWLITAVKERHPETIFLAEAFTRPKLVRKLAKLGFSQSYTYFTWRHGKAELTAYLGELTRGPAAEYLRPNLFVNTPDINPRYLQTGGRAAFQIRAVLAGTLSSVWGMYSGFELCEAAALPGEEEYRDSEKYEIRAWDWERPSNIRDYVTRLNRIRRENPALHTLANLRFYRCDGDGVLFYGKMTAARDNIILVAAALDPHRTAETVIELPLEAMGAEERDALAAEELLSGARLAWQGRRQRIRLDPAVNPCAIWRIAPPRA